VGIAEIGGEHLELGRGGKRKVFFLERFLKSWERISAANQAVDS